jgi:DNA-binding PadR family transcriptional regulator
LDRALYPALHKLEQQGWIKAEWKISETNRRAKYYSLTRAGRKAFTEEAANWERLFRLSCAQFEGSMRCHAGSHSSA